MMGKNLLLCDTNAFSTVRLSRSTAGKQRGEEMGSGFTVFFAVLYVVVGLAICIYLVVLARSFVKAHERGAAALEVIAQKLDRDAH
jgi:hypothetical protein